MRPISFLPTSALLLGLALSACDVPEPSQSAGVHATSVAAEVTRLRALGFRQVGGRASDGSVRLEYSGPVNGAVLCAPPGGQPARIQAQSSTADGRNQTIGLDAFVTLSPGADGVLQPNERDGLYVVTIVTRSGRAAPTVQGITFGPGGQGTFRSGLTCRAA